MKKALFLLVSLLSISSLTVFAGCNQNGDGSASAKGNVTRLVAQDDGAEAPDDGNGENDGANGSNCGDGDICPDKNCKKGMPKVRFGHKHGRPAEKQTETDTKEAARHGEHRGERGRRHKRPRPAPPADGNGENGN